MEARRATRYPITRRRSPTLARLYESVGQWSKVIESLTRELDVARLASGSTGQRRRARAAPARRRDLREGAGAARSRHRGLRGAARRRPARRRAPTSGARAALREARPLAAISRRCSRARVARAAAIASARARLLERRAQLLADRSATTRARRRCCAQLRKLRPDDDAIAARLERALEKAGTRDEQAEASCASASRTPGDAARPRTSGRGCSSSWRGSRPSSSDAQAAQRTLETRARAGARRSARARRAGAAARGRLRLGRLRGGARARGGGGADRRAGGARAGRRGARARWSSRKDDRRRARARAGAREGSAIADGAGAARRRSQRRPADDNAADGWRRRELALDAMRAVAASGRRSCRRRSASSRLRRGELDEAAQQLPRGARRSYPAIRRRSRGSPTWRRSSGALGRGRGAVARRGAARRRAAEVAAQFHRRLADAAEQQGRADEAYAALLEADRLLPGDLRTRLRARREPLSRQSLSRGGAVSGAGRRASRRRAAAGGGRREALYHGALAELKLRRPEQALPLLEAAVRIHPQSRGGAGPPGRARARGRRLSRARLDLLERQAAATAMPAERALRFERVADVDLVRAERYQARACAAFERALEAGGRRRLRRRCSSKALRLRARGGQHRARGRDGGAAGRARRRARRRRSGRARAARSGVARRRARPQRLGAGAAAHRRSSSIRSTHEALAGLSAMLVHEGKRRRGGAAPDARAAAPAAAATPASRAGARHLVDAARRVPRAACATRKRRDGRVREGAGGRSVAAAAARAAARALRRRSAARRRWCARTAR